MHLFLTIVHVVVCGIMIAMVLLQQGKGADIGATFGGASQTVFGPRGAQSFLAKLTTAAAIIFMLTSLALALMATHHSSIMENVQQAQPHATAPAATAPAPQTPAPVPAK